MLLIVSLFFLDILLESLITDHKQPGLPTRDLTTWVNHLDDAA